MILSQTDFVKDAGEGGDGNNKMIVDQDVSLAELLPQIL